MLHDELDVVVEVTSVVVEIVVDRCEPRISEVSVWHEPKSTRARQRAARWPAFGSESAHPIGPRVLRECGRLRAS